MKLHLPVDIIMTSDTCSDTLQLLENMNCTSICIVTGMNSAHKNGLLDALVAALTKNGITTMVCNIAAEPTSDAVDAIAEQIIQNNVQIVIALGGGSVIDASKAAAIQSVNGKMFSDIEFNTADLKKGLPTIAIPTVSGSGSETTPYSVINNSQTGRKSTIYHDSLFPVATIIEPSIFTSVPPRQTVAGALDALVHCLEAFTSTQSQPVIDALAAQGASLVFNNLQQALDDPNDLAARKALAEASLLGGASIAHVRTGAIHTLSVALQKYSDLPHGLLNTALVPSALSLNSDSYNGKLGDFMSRCGFKAANDLEGADIVNQQLSIYESYTKNPFAVPSENLESVIDRFKQDKGLLQVNPRNLTKTTIEEFVTDVVTKGNTHHA